MQRDLLAAADVLCPMNLWLSAKGHITHAGPTLQKLRDDDLAGQRFLDVFEMLRPHAAHSMDDLRAAAGQPIRMRFRGDHRTTLKGVLAVLGDSLLINLSFGISVQDAVREYRLSSRDFAPTDLAVEMLYLLEAKSAAMNASRQLNTRLQAAMIAAEEQAFTDTLTGVKNRRALDHVLERLIEARQPFALMQIDLDYFKQVNDTLGHAAGDHVLQKVARILVNATRSDDIVARVGGDEFVLIFRSVVERDTLSRLARRMIAEIEAPIPFEGDTCRISASAGTAISSDYRDAAAAQVLADADAALYVSKRSGRAQHRFHEPGMSVAEAGTGPDGGDGADEPAGSGRENAA